MDARYPYPIAIHSGSGLVWTGLKLIELYVDARV